MSVSGFYDDPDNENKRLSMVDIFVDRATEKNRRNVHGR